MLVFSLQQLETHPAQAPPEQALHPSLEGGQKFWVAKLACMGQEGSTMSPNSTSMRT